MSYRNGKRRCARRDWASSRTPKSFVWRTATVCSGATDSRAKRIANGCCTATRRRSASPTIVSRWPKSWPSSWPPSCRRSTAATTIPKEAEAAAAVRGTITKVPCKPWNVSFRNATKTAFPQKNPSNFFISLKKKKKLLKKFKSAARGPKSYLRAVR